MSDKIMLYGHHESGHTYKVALMLAIADVPHQYVHVDIFQARDARPAAFRAASKFGEVPVLVHNDVSYVQSNAILHHLAEHTKHFGGENEARLDRCREWLFWESNRLAMSLPHIRFARKFAPEQYSEGALWWLLKRCESDIARLENELSDGRNFMLDDVPTIADFSLCGYLFWADQAQIELPEVVKHWLNNIAALPGYKAAYDLLGKAIGSRAAAY
jgi:glutathione S-transferase